MKELIFTLSAQGKMLYADSTAPDHHALPRTVRIWRERNVSGSGEEGGKYSILELPVLELLAITRTIYRENGRFHWIYLWSCIHPNLYSSSSSFTSFLPLTGFDLFCSLTFCRGPCWDWCFSPACLCGWHLSSWIVVDQLVSFPLHRDILSGFE